MPRSTLLDFFADFSRHPGDFLIYDDGYRTRTHSYEAVARAARAFAARLHAAGLKKGDRVILWSENRPEWIVGLWGCLLRGGVVVPIDYRASSSLLRRVQQIVEASLLLVGQDVQLPSDGDRTPVWRLAEIDWPVAAVPIAGFRTPAIGQDDLAEIIFTSGATAEPKGVQITHRNILANIVPVEREVLRYRKYGRPFFPIRFLNLLPLSHMFGQAMATFIPPMLPGTAVFVRSYNPVEILHQIKARRVSVLVCVPKILDVLRDHVIRLAPETSGAPARRSHWLVRWWRYRRVHRFFGWKFWSFVVGAAPLDPELEEFWSRLGFLVIQGYGLTETAPIVTLNHPLAARRGTVGKPIPGVEVKIASDGEILVRGDNVTSGYYHADADTAAAFAEGWLRTGDIGEFDDTGRLVVKGRKKEMIVTPEGLNVFPEDVERVLDEVPGVRESAAVGLPSGGQERVHAVLVLEPGADPDGVIRNANARLESYQKIKSASVWPGRQLPRTEGTRKLKRHELRRWAAGEAAPASDATGGRTETIASIVSRFAGGCRDLPPARLDELGISSLERVELMLALEDRFDTTIDEMSFASARTVGDLRSLVDEPGRLGTARPQPALEPIAFPRWNRSLLPRAVRRACLPTWILPLARIFVWLRVDGLSHLEPLQGPVVFAANHQSLLDTPSILAALPPRWRYRVAPAISKEFFRAHFFPREFPWRARLTNSLNYYLASLLFNVFPLPQREAGARQALRYAGELVSDGYSILIFPEGMHGDGEINPFQAGVGMLASRLDIPVVPVRLEGVERVLHRSWRMARPGRVRVTFGEALRLRGDDFAPLAARVEEAVRQLGRSAEP